MKKRKTNDVRLDVVVPLYNEIDVVEQLHRRLVDSCRKLPARCRIVYVDDGSQDATVAWIKERCESTQDSDILLLELSRNFGQPSAIMAGLEETKLADCVVLMDGDLQDPPELFEQLFAQWNDGYDVVIARREKRKESLLRRTALLGFHKVFQNLTDMEIPANTGTFCLLDQTAVASICELPESHRFFPGLRAWVGFNQVMVDYERPDRAAGEPKQSFRRLFKYALDAIFGYSLKPVRMLTWVGLLVCTLSMTLASWFLMKRLMGWEQADLGFTTLICAITGLGGLQLLGMGILGEYVGRIYDEVKRRPQFVVKTRTQYSQSEIGLMNPEQSESKAA